jgi:hypothetical protein
VRRTRAVHPPRRHETPPVTSTTMDSESLCPSRGATSNVTSIRLTSVEARARSTYCGGRPQPRSLSHWGGLESFGGFRDTSQRCLLSPPDAKVPVHQLDALRV